VRSKGEIKWAGDFVFVSEVLNGEPVGVAENENGDWIVRFADLNLGIIDRRTKKLRRFAAPRQGAAKQNRPRNLSPMSPIQKCHL
jgi:putative transposase